MAETFRTGKRLQRYLERKESKQRRSAIAKESSESENINFDAPAFDFSEVDMDKVLDFQFGSSGVINKEQEQPKKEMASSHSKPESIMEAVSQNDIASLKAIVESERDSAQTGDSKASKLQDTLNCALLHAVTSKSAKLVAVLLDLGAEVQNSQCLCPITLSAIMLGSEELVDLFMERGLSFVVEGTDDTVLHCVARTENVNILEKMLSIEDVRAQINNSSKLIGATPFLVACQYGRIQCAQLLINAGAKIDDQDDHGRTALHFAALGGSNDLVQLLLSHGASTEVYDNNSKTPWLHALLYSHTDTMDLLETEGGCAGIASVLRNGKNYLHLAAGMGSIGAVSGLLERGCDPTSQDDQGNTPLIYAVSSSFVLPALVNRLLDSVTCKQTINVTNHKGQSAFSVIMHNGQFSHIHREVASALVAAGADVNHRGLEGETVLMTTLLYENVVSFLLDNGADINAVNHDNMSCLSYALQRGNRYSLQTLLYNNIDIRLVSMPCTSTGNTPFIEALESGDIRLVHILDRPGNNLNGISEWWNSHMGLKTVQTFTDIKNYIEQLERSGRLGQPLSLWKSSRVVVLAAIGRIETHELKTKLSLLGLPPLLISALETDDGSTLGSPIFTMNKHPLSR